MKETGSSARFVKEVQEVPPKAVSGQPRDLTEIPPELYLYREHTVALLRRYFRLSVELGRLPSLLGREFFRARVSSYRLSTFEDGVIFVHDVERCLEKLDPMGRQLMARIVFQEYTADETAAMLQCTRRTIVRRYADALDRLSEIFLGTGLLRAFAAPRRSDAETTGLRQPSGEISACSEVSAWPSRKMAGKAVKVLPVVIPLQPAVVKANIFSAKVSHLPRVV
jgi:hypothetical protein